MKMLPLKSPIESERSRFFRNPVLNSFGPVGEEAGPEGVIGFARAFLAAGSLDVAVSLWSIHDGAALALMPAFHRARSAGGLPAAEALRRAKVLYLEEGHRAVDVGPGGRAARGKLDVVPAGARDPRHPFYWAPVVLIGRGGSP